MTPAEAADMRPAAMEAELGPDLWAIVAAIGAPLVEVVPVTTIRSAGSYRASFRLTLADGQVLKGRRLNAPADVARLTRLLPLLDPRYFPPILTRCGRALLTRWIAGRPAGPEAWTTARLRTCGLLHADIHRLPVSAELATLQPAIAWTERLDRWLGDLVAGEALRAAEASEISRLVVDSAPTTARTGLCHTDFCADNIIITEVGGLCVIDNEGLSLDAPEFDLARTWYRWPMTPTQQAAYADGYAAPEHSARFAAHFLHWALLAVLDSAAYRVRIGAASARVPLDRLAELRRTLGENESFPRFLSRRGP